MIDPVPVSAADLVKEGAVVRGQIKALQAKLKGIEAEIIARGAGKYSHGSASCFVVDPKPKFAPTPEAILQVRELIGDAKIFKKLFTRSIVFSPVEGVRAAATALLTPAKLEKFFALCNVPTKSFLKW